MQTGLWRCWFGVCMYVTNANRALTLLVWCMYVCNKCKQGSDAVGLVYVCMQQMQTGDLLQTELQLCTAVRPTVRPLVTYSDFFMARGRQTYNHVVWNFLMTSCTRSNRTIRPTRDDQKVLQLGYKKLTYYITHAVISWHILMQHQCTSCGFSIKYIHSFVRSHGYLHDET